MGFTVSLVLVSSVFLMSLGYPYTTDFQDQPNRISQTVSSGCIPLYTHCIIRQRERTVPGPKASSYGPFPGKTVYMGPRYLPGRLPNPANVVLV